MKEAIAIIEKNASEFRQKADKLSAIANDLRILYGIEQTPVDPEPEKPSEDFVKELLKQPKPVEEPKAVITQKKKVQKKTSIEKAKAATKQFFPTGRDVFTESAVSKNGKNFIPSDQMILETLKSLNTEANSGTVKNELMKKSELPILQQIVENGLKRLCKMELVLKNATTRPITWAVKQMESQAEEPKKLVLTDDMYENRQLFAKSKGYENAADAMGEMGADVFQQEFKKFMAFQEI